MADKATKGKGTRKKKDTAAANGAGSGGMGHNLTELRKLLEPFFKRFLTLTEEMESDMGEYRVDFKNLYGEISDKTGASRKVIRKEFRRALRLLREEQEEREMEVSERDATETLRAAFDGTPFGKYFADKLADASPGQVATS